MPAARIATAEAQIAAGERQWVSFDLQWQPETARNAFLVIKANDAVTLHQAVEPATGVFTFYKGDTPVVDFNLGDNQPQQPVSQWRMEGKSRRCASACWRLPLHLKLRS